jgi:hypothetical protein
MAIPSTQISTVDFLPEIFQTPVNKQFLAATLDQLVQEPQFKQTQGYIGQRVGPGVNANNHYVVEPTAARTNYQLEPGVIQVDPGNTHTVIDAITYPGITDALNVQGAITTNPQSLYTSDYYTWDPFVDLDKFVNYAQYYWLPRGPLAVDVYSSAVPLSDDFTVTRDNGYYTFSGYAGNNPSLTLVRGGNYNFNVAQNTQAAIEYRVTNNTTSWSIDYAPNPTLTLVRGNTYTFNLTQTIPYKFYIKTELSYGTTNLYNNGVFNNGASAGLITFTVPQDAPDVLYYCNDAEFNFRGQLNIVNATPGTGPGFWIQAAPGVSGVLPATPNISSRGVLGVVNNGEDLGTVTFNVPTADAQNFYYNMPSIGTVDLATTLNFDQINNQSLKSFINAYPDGIDGITNLNNRTVIFINNDPDPESGGWQQTTFFDPLVRTAPNQVGQCISYDVNGQPYDSVPYETLTDVIVSGSPDPQDGQPGSFDSIPFDQTTLITDPTIQFGVWQIQYVTAQDGETYISLASVKPIDNLNKFTILFGNQWASTQWYKNSSGLFAEMPLLTATATTLYYQDGTDPAIFGLINLVDQVTPPLNIADIIGHQTYTSPNGVKFSNGMKVIFRGTVVPSSYENQSYYVEGVGTAIRLLPVENYVTPETYTKNLTIPYDTTPYDSTNFDGAQNAPTVPDYLTINRASPALDPWSRSNRWVHKDVINASAAYNNTTPVLDNKSRAQRPILEFRAGTKLYNFGTQGVQPVNIVDLKQQDALTNINGATGYSIDGYQFISGTTVIFTNDLDPNVRNKIYQVEFIVPDTVPPLIPEPIIYLNPIATVLIDQNTVSLDGVTQQGISYYYDGVNWLPAQQKHNVNQPPLFDVYDSNGVSFGDQVIYPSTNFHGSPLFSYAISTNAPDLVLGFPITYLSLTNLGDIVFDNNLYADSFKYTINNQGKTVPLSLGFVREYQDRTNFIKEIGWQTAVTPSLIRQQFKFTYDGSPLLLDVAVNPNDTVPAVQIFINAAFVEPYNATTKTYNYIYTTGADTTTINLLTTYVPGDQIEVLVLSNQTSATAFYEVPINLENNPFNENSNQFTLGTIRNHYSTIAQNLIPLQGPVIGANNTRDLGNIIPYGLQILQQSSPLTLTGYFMRSQQYNIFSALAYNSRQYIKFKSELLQAVTTFGLGDYENKTVAELLDSAIAQVTLGDTNMSPFYWSDMLPTGTSYISNSITVTPITTQVFNTVQTYNFTESNYLGLLVYINNVLLTRDRDYVVSMDSPVLTITVPLNMGDIVTINEYSNTTGNFVPNTPTKLGLYPKYRPEIFLDNDYVNPTPVIQGHDGSITVAFGDIRDSILLEFETRIYNNLKNDGNPVPLTAEDVIPGYFRTTDYTQEEINQILGEDFLSWVGYNKVDYTTQTYIANNEYTYNYSQAGNKLDGAPLLGAWRGIYRYFYDCLTPNLTPWELLGLSEEPTWWTTRYGPAPYTSDNLVLWGDLERGLVADPVAPYIKPNYVRPGLTSVIPVDSQGQLISPLKSVVGRYDPNGFVKSWTVGDGGPVEASWWMSSSYPFAVMRLLALTRPAEFFSLFVDRDLYRYNVDFDQYLYNNRYRVNPASVQVYGNGVSKASYINWIVDYNQQLGIDSASALTTDLASLDVRLCYRMASFAAQENVNIYMEKSSPESNNATLMIPPESYNLQLYQNQPYAEMVYSSVVIEKVESGYAVFGYSSYQPYFTILSSLINNNSQTITAGNTSVNVPTQYSDKLVKIPYGYTFSNLTSTVDFILSYGAYLASQGMSFTQIENGYVLNWLQMAQEFLYFANQGWATGTLINLNPAATQLSVYRPGSVVDSIVTYTPENVVLDQNRKVVNVEKLIIQRLGDSFVARPQRGGSQTINFTQFKFTDFEDIVIFDNKTIFNDLIYDPITAERQSRLILSAQTSTQWDGTLNAQGFILNNPLTVHAWQPNTSYAKGDIVTYQYGYWQAAGIIQPSTKFVYSNWYKSNYQKIQQGLLQNLALKADQLTNSYSVQNANLNSASDLLAFNLIGFTPRQYMTDLNLDSVSQVNIYQQFIGTKGSLNATGLLTNVNFNQSAGQYNIYQDWGILVGTYGANANRSWFEVNLNEALLTGNPSTVQIIQPGETSEANQAILLSNLWAESYKIPSTDILPTTYARNLDTALPTAGYVNLNDVDITVFNLNNPSSIAAHLSMVGNGTSIWVAQDNSYNWNIYQCVQVPGRVLQLTDNLNGTSIVQFSGLTTGLSVGDLIIIKYFDSTVDGVYRVLSLPSINSVVIRHSFTNQNKTSITGTGIAFQLQNMRVNQASDVINLPYATSLVSGATAWVDNDGNGHWEVIQKQAPFVEEATLVPTTPVNNELYGYSVAQSQDNRSLLVGSPGSASGAGELFIYKSSVAQPYVQNNELSLLAANVVGFGNTVDFGNQTWAVAGASASYSGAGYATVLYRLSSSNDFLITQLLTAPDLDFSASAFGTAAIISDDERWMYISAPGANKVYTYGLVTVEPQVIIYTGDGVTSTFTYVDNIVINSANPQQLEVYVDNNQQVYGQDYVITPNLVQMFTPPKAGQIVTISRRNQAQLDYAVYYNLLQNSTTGSGINARFTVTNTRGVYNTTLTYAGENYNIGDTLTINYTQIDPAGSSSNNLVITVTDVNDGGITAFTTAGSAVSTTATFSLTDYFYTVNNIYSFTVNVNGTFQRPNIDYTYSAGNITFTTVPAAGAVIVVNASSYWQYMSTLTVGSLSSTAGFGNSLSCTTDGRQVLIGANNDSAVDATGSSISHAGSVYAFDRSVIKYIISNPTQSTYAIPGSITQPVAVVLNNQYLTNTDDFINGQYTVSGSNVVLSSSVTLVTGDVLEIETNQFQLLQKLAANTVIDQALFGQSVAVCPHNCSVYVGAPNTASTTGLAQAGLIQRQVNQSRLYGITTTTVANPTLTAGNTLRINDLEVVVPAAPKNTVAGLVDAINSKNSLNITSVISNGTTATLTFDTQTQHPYAVGQTITVSGLTGTAASINGTYLVTGCTNNTVSYNNATYIATTPITVQATVQTPIIPNVVASLVPDVILTGNGSTKIFDIGNIYSSASAYNTVVYVGATLKIAGVDYTYNNATQQISFVTAPALGAVITVKAGKMTISVVNALAATEFNMLTVLPGTTGSAFTDLGFTTYAYTQTIVSPNPVNYARFGSSISVDTSAINLVVGTPNGNVYEPTTFDAGKTYFDEHSTTFFDLTSNSGVVYTFDYLPSSSSSLSNPGKFVFGQQIYSSGIATVDQFGAAVSYQNGLLLVGAPGSNNKQGYVSVFNNPDRQPAWSVIYKELPTVDVALINSVYSYDKLLNSTQTYFDFIDPLQGKILGVARRNIDYIGAVDPANYNTGSIHNNGTSWGAGHVGQIWWDTNTVRFVEPNQENITYASRQWAQTFPGSTIDIYQWVESSTPPASYTGAGTPFSTVSYTVKSSLNNSGIFVTNYYFWVTGIRTIDTANGKTLSTTGIASYIANPGGSGIPYIAAINANTVALYNAKSLLSASDTILHVEYERQAQDSSGDIHTEYEFIADGRPDSFLNPNLYRKLLDSFSGQDTAGNIVPDPFLNPGQRYGVQFRPRQSMFADRFKALENYLGRVNNVLAQYPISEIRSFNLLNSSEPIPQANSGAWDFEVPNLEVLNYQDLLIVPIGYRYLVRSDSSQFGRWTIYEVIAGATPKLPPSLTLVRIQNYDTPLYWSYINWYLPGYNSSIQPIATVANVSALQTLSVSVAPVGSSVRVIANGVGKWEIYLRTATGTTTNWKRVGLEDGTIAFSESLWNYSVGGFGFGVEPFDAQYYDQYPAIETRYIIEAINQELLIEELLLERNQALILMFQYIYSEFTSPNWLIKSSFVEVDHTLRALLPYQLYQADNSTFVESYLQEVKPFHTQTLAFNLIYDGIDTWGGYPTDYDAPAYWNTLLETPQFVSPVLTPYTLSGSLVENTVSNAAPNAQIWLEEPWSEWYNNYLLSIDSVTVYSQGTGYTSPPQVLVNGVVDNNFTAVVNSAGQVIAVNIANNTESYSVTPTITLLGGNGSGAVAVPVMVSGLVRSIKTVIKYDRYQYASTIVEWQANATYAAGDQVRWNNLVWSANTTINSSIFDPTQWTRVVASTLSGVDRTMGYYVPGPNMPGLSLPLLIDGVEYPGVQVTAPTYSQNTGYDIGNFDINPYDNISYDLNGRPTYDYGILDAQYSSSYLDLYLGTRATDINVDGGAYIDTFSSYAPEELVPGSEFDALDMRVYSTPGSNWTGQGFGFPAANRRYVFDPENPVLSFTGILQNAMVVTMFNATLGWAIEPLSYDWANYELTVDLATASAGDVLVISVAGIGGGDQLYNQTYLGSELIDGNKIIIPFATPNSNPPLPGTIYEFVIYNGEIPLTHGVDYTYVAAGENRTQITFSHTYDNTNRINLSTLGYPSSGPVREWSLPVFETVVIDSTTASTLTIPLTNSMQGTNPVNLVVTVNGIRARPSDGARYIANGTTTTFNLPNTGGYSLTTVANNDVSVYVDNQALILGVNFAVNPASSPSLRTVTLFSAPPAGSVVLISVRTAAQYWITNNQLTFQPTAGLHPSVGDIVEIVSWNDTSEQGILTQVFVGPTTTGATIIEGYDLLPYDSATVNNTSGSYNFTEGVLLEQNIFDTGRVIVNPEKLLVTLNGKWLFNGIDYTIKGSTIVIPGAPISGSAVVAITTFTEYTVPGAIAFRIFQDMRGLQATYSITPSTTTTTTQAVAIDSDIIYVTDAMALTQPNIDNNIWGVLTIDAERIMYRYWDANANTVSGLLRGTGGTAIAAHDLGATVYNLGRNNLLPVEYQDHAVSNSAIANGTQTMFTAADISLVIADAVTWVFGGTYLAGQPVVNSGNYYRAIVAVPANTAITNTTYWQPMSTAVQVFVGGILQTTGYTVTGENPVTVLFGVAPVSGAQVTIAIRRGLSWYQPGLHTASDGVPLQETNTVAARFLRGL